MSGGLRRTFSSLSVYNYRLYWLGQLVSISGTWMQTTAQAWLVLKLTNSPAALGVVTMLQFLPVTLLALFGGVFADRVSKRRMVFCTQSVAAAQSLVLAFLVLSGNVRLWEVGALALLLGVVNAFDNPTRQAFVVELVGKEQLQNAVALNSSLFNSARIIGPAVGGVVISTLGIGQAFLLNGLSFLPLLVGLLRMRAEEFHEQPQPARGSVFGQLGEGVRYALSTPSVLFILMAVGVLGAFGYNFSTILPLLARFVLHSGALGLGLLTSATGIGSLVAALAVAYRSQRASRAVLLTGAVIFSILLFLTGASRWMPLTLLLLGLLGAAGIVFTSSANTNLQVSVPNRLRGRVMSLYFLLFAGTTPFGSFLIGTLSDRIGVQTTVMLMGGICFLGVVAAGAYASTRSEPARGDSAPEHARPGTGAGGFGGRARSAGARLHRLR